MPIFQPDYNRIKGVRTWFFFVLQHNWRFMQVSFVSMKIRIILNGVFNIDRGFTVVQCTRIQCLGECMRSRRPGREWKTEGVSCGSDHHTVLISAKMAIFEFLLTLWYFFFFLKIDVMILRTSKGQDHEERYFKKPTPLLERFCCPEVLDESEEKKKIEELSRQFENMDQSSVSWVENVNDSYAACDVDLSRVLLIMSFIVSDNTRLYYYVLQFVSFGVVGRRKHMKEK